MEKKYAYIHDGTLHISYRYEDAKETSSNGIVVETTFPADRGFPVINGDCVIMNGIDDIRWYADGPKLNAAMYPELGVLYKKCMGE